MLTGIPLIVVTAVPLTRLLMKGALGFWKIGWIGPENWLAGCVQLWFSMAITKTVLTERPSSARAFHWIERVSRASKPSVPKRLTCNIDCLQMRGWRRCWRSQMVWTNTSARAGLLLEDESRMTFANVASLASEIPHSGL